MTLLWVFVLFLSVTHITVRGGFGPIPGVQFAPDDGEWGGEVAGEEAYTGNAAWYAEENAKRNAQYGTPSVPYADKRPKSVPERPPEPTAWQTEERISQLGNMLKLRQLVRPFLATKIYSKTLRESFFPEDYDGTIGSLFKSGSVTDVDSAMGGPSDPESPSVKSGTERRIRRSPIHAPPEISTQVNIYTSQVLSSEGHGLSIEHTSATVTPTVDVPEEDPGTTENTEVESGTPDADADPDPTEQSDVGANDTWTATGMSAAADDLIPLYLMGFSSIDVVANGWSSAGVIPSLEMAMEDVNRREDLLVKYKLYLDIKDSQCDAGRAIQGFYEHIFRAPTKIMIIGGGCSVATVPVAKTAPYFGLVQMGYSAASPELSQRGSFPTFFRTAASDLALNKPTVRLCQYFDWNNVATLHESDPMFSMTMNQLHYLFFENNITVLTAESFTVNPTEPIRNIKRKNAKIIIYTGYEGAARLVFCQVYRQDMYGAKYQWIIPGWYNENWYDVNDTMCTTEQVHTASQYALTVADLKMDLSGNITFSGQTYDEYEWRYLNRPSLTQYGTNAYHPNGYDAIWAVALALNATDAIIANMNVTIMDENGTEYTRPKRLDDFRYAEETEISALIYAALMEINFHGVSGPVSFYLGERNANCELGQLQGDDKIRVAVYVADTDTLVFVDDANIAWQGDGPPEDVLTPRGVVMYKDPILVVSACALAAAGTVVALVFLIFNIRNREKTYIKMSSPRLNNVILFGALLAFAAVVFFGIDTQFVSTNAMGSICMARAWCLALAFTLAFGAMFAKTWRVHVIFTRKFSLTTKPVYDVHLIGFVVFLVLLDVGMLAAWNIVDPFQVEYTVLSEEEGSDYIVTNYLENCMCDKFWYWMGAMYGVKGLLLLFGCFLAYETRQVEIPGLNDSKYIGLCVYNVVVMCMVGVTVSLVISYRATITYAFQAFTILFCACTTLFVLFVPKISHVIKAPPSRDTGKNARSGQKSHDTESNGSGSTTFRYTVKGLYRQDSIYTINTTDSENPATSRLQKALGEKDQELSDIRRRYNLIVLALKELSPPEEALQTPQTRSQPEIPAAGPSPAPAPVPAPDPATASSDHEGDSGKRDRPRRASLSFPLRDKKNRGGDHVTPGAGPCESWSIY